MQGCANRGRYAESCLDLVSVCRVGGSIVWNRIARTYRTRFVNDPLRRRLYR